MKIWLNHHLVSVHQAKISVFDHSFLYGDGVYETVKAVDYKIFQWPAHDRRLRQSARAIGLSCPWSSAFLVRAMTRLLHANHRPDGVLRISISRGEGPLGLDPTLCSKPTLVILPHPVRPLSRLCRQGVSVILSRVRRAPAESLNPAIKSNNALHLILAKKEAARAGAFEALLLNARGDLTEGTISNLFFLKQNCLCTPALECGLLPGVTRSLVLRLARRSKVNVQEGCFSPQDLWEASEILLTSTGFDILPVRSIRQGARQRTFTPVPGPFTRWLLRLYSTALL